MRLTTEEINKLTQYLISVLERKRFSVDVNRYGSIKAAEKFGIRCCPAIINSLEDGKQGYAYIQLVTNPYSEKDLGSYYKPRTNKSNYKLYKENNSVDKYSGKDIHIDNHNYRKVIETFVDDLNKDYMRIVNKREDVNESLNEALVKIKNTNTVFDGMTGVVEDETENKVTVLVNFNDEHKVRNTFKKDQIELLEE